MMYKSTHTQAHAHTHACTPTHNLMHTDPSLRTRVTVWLVASSGIQEVRGRHVQQLQLVSVSMHHPCRMVEIESITLSLSASSKYSSLFTLEIELSL